MYIVNGHPIVSGTVGTMPELPVESPQTGYYLDLPEAPVKPYTPVTTPSSAPISDGSAGIQVTSGVSGSHDTVGINGSVLNSLAQIGNSDVTTAPTGTPVNDSGYGVWIVAAVVIGAIWFLMK